MKILENFSFTDYKKHSKNYNVNVYKQTRMVHKKDGCHWAASYQFIPFDTLEEIDKFQTQYGVKFTYCQNPKCGFKK